MDIFIAADEDLSFTWEAILDLKREYDGQEVMVWGSESSCFDDLVEEEWWWVGASGKLWELF